MTSLGDIALGPLSCQLCPSGDDFSGHDLGWVRVIMAGGVSRRG